MKIITTGKAERSIRVTCDVCKAVFDVEPEELKVLKIYKDYRVDTVQCPCCKRDVWIRTDK